MKKVVTLALVATMVTGAYAQVQTKTETTVKTQTDPAGTVQTTKEKTVVQNGTHTRLHEAYRHAGVSDADIVRLRTIDNRVIDARRANPKAPVDTYYTEQTKILKPAQVEKVRTYLREHPAPAQIPAYEVTTYETVPTRTGVEINTPLGSVGLGVNTGEKVIERKEVVPAQ